MKQNFLQIINDPHSRTGQLHELLQGNVGLFAFCFGSTETSEIDGISAAGATAADRRLTPSIDADVLASGLPRSNEVIPTSPIGIVSPVVITKACLELLEARPLIIDCGTFRTPLHSDVVAGTIVAKSVSTGCALPYESVLQLFDAGCNFAKRQLQKKPPYMVLSECVPGGTTTALAVLRASGVAADDLVSSSLPRAALQRKAVVTEGLALAKLEVDADPLKMIAAVGDPMQPFVIGAALTASKHVPVILGGGSQMLAVFHMCERLSKFKNESFARENVYVITTKWISGDENSNTRELSRLLDVPFFASAPDFHCSRFAGLQAYEQGHVKEGVGAGALMAVTLHRCKLSNAQLTTAIDDCYEEIVLRPAVKIS